MVIAKPIAGRYDEMMRRSWFSALFFLGLLPLSVCAHAPDFDWKQVGEKIEVEAFFDDGTPIREAKVQILDDKRNILVSGVTDARGRCKLTAPDPGRYQLFLDAGAGHRKERAITIVGTLPVSPVDGGPSSDPPAQSPRRDDLIRFPWERVLVGLGIIALVGGAWWWSRRT